MDEQTIPELEEECKFGRPEGKMESVTQGVCYETK